MGPVLNDDELARLVATAEWQATLIDRRDAAIIRTFISTGARASEVANLRVDDVDLLRRLAVRPCRSRDPP